MPKKRSFLPQIGTYYRHIKPLAGETFPDTNTMLKKWIANDNPDTVVENTGDLSAYKNMVVTDACVSQSVEFLVNHTVTSDFNITCLNVHTGKNDNEMSDFIEESLRTRMARRLDVCARELFRSAVICGYTVAETIWGQQDGEAFLVNIKSKDPDKTRFETDEFSNIIAIRYQDPQTHTWKRVRDPYKFIIYVRNCAYSNYYGQSDLRPAWAAYQMRKAFMHDFALYIERLAFPALIGVYEDRGDSRQQQGKLLNLLTKIRSSIVGVMPHHWDVRQIKLDPADAQQFALNNKLLQEEIRAAILGGHLNVGEGTSSASRSAGDLHEANIMFKIEEARRELEDCFDRSVLYNLAVYKFGVDRVNHAPPKITFVPHPTHNVLESAQAISYLAQIGVRFDSESGREFLRQKFNLPDDVQVTAPVLQMKTEDAQQKEMNLIEKRRSDTKYIKKQTRSDQAVNR